MWFRLALVQAVRDVQAVLEVDFYFYNILHTHIYSTFFNLSADEQNKTLERAIYILSSLVWLMCSLVFFLTCQ